MQILYHFPHTATNSFKPKYDKIVWLNEPNSLEAWKKGETGFPLVDAGMKELNNTGFMHNRVRMITASFLCKHLLVDWRLGEKYFALKLNDYEMSSNVGNWQWASGSGVDAAPYFRIFNPHTQLTNFDKKHKLKVIGSAPLPKEPENIFRKRFGVKEVLPLYGMTEVNIPVYGKLGKKGNGTCGEVYSKYFDVEIRDTNTDQKLKIGEIGEIMVRPKISFGFMQGYLGMPDKSFEAYRNFWFHTGDAGFFNKKNQLIFVDRIKDCIRRRGENISSYEVEQAFLKIPQIAEAAAFAVPAQDHGQEDEVMVALMIIKGSKIEYSKWINKVSADLAKFAIPLYLRVMKSFPKTQTGKIIKHALRTEGITNDTWKNNL